MIGLLMAKRTFDRLSADLKTAVQESATEARGIQRRQNAEATTGFLTNLRTRGMQINEVPDKAAFRRGVMPMYESFRGAIGADIIRDALAAVQ